MASVEHWEHVYGTKAPDEVSWYQEVPLLTLRLIAETQLDVDAPIIDVGGGASNLADCLLRAGYRNITVLDIAEAALDHARERLGEDAARLKWIHGDVTSAPLGGPYALWHDRAVFHFMVRPETRAAYRAQLLAHLRPAGTVVMATFGLEGPDRCSGLPVERYSAESLARELGPELELVRAVDDVHTTPRGTPQAFLHCVFRRR